MLKEHLMVFFPIAALFALSEMLHAEETSEPAKETPALTLATVVKDLENKVRQLAASRPPRGVEVTAAEAKTTASDQEVTAAESEIFMHLIHRSSLERNPANPSDPYYLAIRQQLQANIDMESLKIWWKHCRTDTPYESLTRLDQLPLSVELANIKTQAETAVVGNQPVVILPESPDIRGLDSSISASMSSDNSLLDQIDGWKTLPEESKSKIISR